jgi:hypothetical protein
MINLDEFKAPSTEVAVYKNVPIAHLKTVQALLRGQKLRFIFRGPRTGDVKTFTMKRDAVAFSVYKNWNL